MNSLPRIGLSDWIVRRPRRGAASPRSPSPVERVRRLGGIAAIGTIALALGMLAAAQPFIAAMLAVLAGLVVFAMVCTTWPRVGIVILFASLALVPVYAVPDLFGTAAQPSAALAGVLAIALARRGPRTAVSVVDVAFVATCAAIVYGAIFGPPRLVGNFVNVGIWAAAYAAGRAICVRRDGPRWIAGGVVLVGLISLPFIVIERLTGVNYFLRLAVSGSTNTVLWAHQERRGDSLIRVEAAFGHPLSMAMIIGSAAVFAVALALPSQSWSRRTCLLGVGAVLALAQSTTNERSGWLVVGGGLLLTLLLAIPRATRSRYAFATGVVAVPAILVILALNISTPSTTTDTSAAAARASSTAYRQALFKHAFDPGALPALGRGDDADQFALEVLPGKSLGSIDSAYLQIGAVNGLVALLPLVAIFAAVVITALRARGTFAAAVPAVTIANMIALIVVGFQTQQIVMVWLLVGASAGVGSALRSRAAATARRSLREGQEATP